MLCQKAPFFQSLRFRVPQTMSLSMPNVFSFGRSSARLISPAFLKGFPLRVLVVVKQ